LMHQLCHYLSITWMLMMLNQLCQLKLYLCL